MIAVKRKYDERTDRLVEATGKCETCGRLIDFMDYDFTAAVECNCGAIYNTSGQRLRPRNQWEEPIEEGD